MQSLQVGPGAAAQRDVETAHAQLRCPLTQSVAMGEDRIVFFGRLGRQADSALRAGEDGKSAARAWSQYKNNTSFNN